jgi:hypothetical protein
MLDGFFDRTRQAPAGQTDGGCVEPAGVADVAGPTTTPSPGAVPVANEPTAEVELAERGEP